MDKRQVDRWLERYVEAWSSYDPERIGELFSDDVECRYHPYDEPVRGREAVVRSWLDDRDEPGTYEASYSAVSVDGDVAVATGSSTYLGADGSVEMIYDNCFVMRFDGDGRCREFTEWFMKRPS